MAALNFPASPSGGQEYSANGKTWKWDGTSWKLKYVTSGATSFIGLSDTPSTFTADKWIKVNSSGNGLEWANAPTGSSGINIKDDQGGVGGNPQDLGNATGLLFNGDGVTASGTGNEKTITIPGGIQVRNEGTTLQTTCFALDFKGAGVTASRTDSTKWITIPGGLQVKDEGSPFTTNATILDFKGTAVNVTEKAGTGGAEKIVTISSGGLNDVVDDTTPQLGGDLDLNGKNVIGTGNFSFTGVLTTRKDDVNSVAQTALQIGRLQNLSSFIVKADGNVTSLGVVESTGFKKTGGTASQYLKADGSVSTLTTFTTSAPGLAPTSPGGTTKYLRADGTWQTIAGGTASSDPIGTIVAWAGASNNLPTGYQLCDGGASGTTELQAIVGANVPDLRDKFIIGAGNSYSVDATGGNKDAIVVQHNHGITDPGHDHRPLDANTVQSMEVGVNSTTEIFAPAIGSGVSNNNASDTSSETTGISINNEGSSGNNANLPPYWALCYIIKNAATTSTGGGDGNDYVTSAQLGTGNDAKKLTLGFTDTTKNQVVDLSSLSTADTNTTYDISLVDGTDANTKKIRLSSSNPTTIDEIIFKQGSYINLIRSGEELEIKSVQSLSGLVDVDYAGQSPTANKILKYSTTVNSGAGGWTLGDDNTGSNNTDTTYSISCVDGDNVDEEKIRLTAGGDGSGTDDIVLEAGTGLTIARSGDKITFTNSISDTDTDKLKDLTDTPNAYDNGKYLKSTATGTEWATVTSGVDKLKDLTDTPNAYDNGKYLKSTATGTEWASVTSGSSYTLSARDHDSDINKKIIRLTDGQTNQDITIKADSYLNISRNGNEIELDSVAALGGLADVDYQGGSPANNKILKYSTSVGGGKWILADDETGGAADGNTTYSLEALISPGIKLTGSDNSNDSVFFDAGTGITLTRTVAPGGTGGGTIKFEASTFTGTAAGLVPASTSGETTKFLKSDGSWDTAGGSITVFDETTELSTGATTLKFAGGMVSATGAGSATKTITIAQPTLEIADGSTASQKKIKLGRGTDADDEIILSQGSYIQLNRSGQTLEIKSVQSLSGLADVDYQGQSPANNKILKYSTSVGGGAWILADDNTGSSADGNNYVTGGSWNSSTGTLTLNRSGLSAVTIGVSNLKTYFENNLSVNANEVKIRTDTGNARHNLVFVDSYTDNLNQTLKIDNADWSCCYNPSSNCLSAAALQSYHMRDWSNSSYGSTGQFLMSQASNGWKWSTHIHQESSGEIRLSGPSGSATTLEGAHLQFEDMNGNTSYAIDVYRNATSGSTANTNKVMRFIDQSTGTERFSIGPQGQWGIGHINRDFGDMGQVMISRGPNLSPVWGNHSGIAGASVTAAQADIDNIYAQLNEIGNDDTIITVAQIKQRLRALARS